MDQSRANSRLLEACNTCRKRKVKCDRQRPICAPCGKSRMECSYTDRVKVLKGPRRRPTRAKQFEERLEKMESLLKLPVAVLERMAKEPGMLDGSDHPVGSTSTGSEASMTDSSRSHEGINGATPSLKNFEINSWAKNDHEVEDFTAVYSDRPIQESVCSTDMTDTGSAYRRVNSFDDSHSPRIFKQLPPKDEAISLLNFFFARFNSVFPLLHQQSFMEIMQVRYSTEYDGDIGWWSNLNMALAHGCRIRTLHSQTAIEDDEDSWGYLENALSVVSFLAIRTPSLPSIQALLGIAVFLQATPVPRSYSLLVANAIRMGHSIGLHRQESYHNGMPVAEIEQRKRVFWISYVLDKDISMRSGQPSVQHDDDIDVELPFDNLSDGVGYIFLAHGLWPMNFLRLRIQLAVIQGAIHRDLYSAKATKNSDSHRAAVVQELDERLKQWKNSTSIDFHPDFLTQKLQEPFDILHIVILHFTYFNCLTLIHRSSFQNMSWKTRAPSSLEPFNPRNFSSKPIVIDTARSALNLLRVVPKGNYACIWLTIQFSCSAIITLLRNIHLNPTLPNAVSDFMLVEPMLEMFCQLAFRHVTSYTNGIPKDGHRKFEKSGIIIELLRMRDFCFVLKDRAKAALDMAMLVIEDSNGAISDSSNHQNTKINGIPVSPSYLGNEKSRVAFVQAFESTFAKSMAVGNGISPPLNASADPSKPTTAPEAPYLQASLLHDHNSYEIQGDYGESRESITKHPSLDPQETSLQELGLWNWWDLIEMDFDGNKQGS